MALLCQDCLGSSKILSGFFLAVSLKTEAALNRHLDLGRINTVATLQSPSKLLSVCVGPIMWSSACSPQAARLRASTHTPCRHSELTDACPNRLTAGMRCGGCGRALRQGWLCRALARCALWSRWVQTWPLSSACLTRPSSSVVVCLETSLLRGRSRLALQHHAPHLCAFSDPPGAGKGLTTHTR